MSFLVLDKQLWIKQNNQRYSMSDKTIVWNISRQTQILGNITIKGDI